MLLSIRLLAGACLLAAIVLAPSVAAAQGNTRVEGGVLLTFLNAPPEGRPIIRPPRLSISFGGRAYAAIMDTGSTGILVSREKIPNLDALQTLAPAELTYTSSGRIMQGRWVLTPVTIGGRNGASITTKAMPVMVVERIRCFANARHCVPDDNPRGVSMMGIGFGREADRQSQSGPDKNPFLNVASVAADDGAARPPGRAGYIVTRRGIEIGLREEAPQGFSIVQLTRQTDGTDWSQLPACIAVNDAKPACGVMLMDTGVTTMYLTVPEEQIAGLQSARASLSEGARVSIAIPSADAPQASYSFAPGEIDNPMRPEKVILVRRPRAPFVNTSVRFLNGFDYLFDAERGQVGLRRRN